jgi:protein-disulfide isomerase
MKQFPVLGDGSVEAAQVGIAVNMVAPDKYFEFHDAMLGEHGQVNGARALAVAEAIGLDRAKIQDAMKKPEVKANIAEVYNLASKLALSGTPSYVTAKEVIVGAVGYDTLKEKIGQARCGAASC